MARCVVALGGNLGPRRALLGQALAALGRLEGTRVVTASPWAETAPERPADGGPYLNGAALLETSLGPRRLLEELLAVERRLGRRRGPRAHGGPRTVDLDLVLYEGQRRAERGLELPHPRFRGRPFVLGPAAAVAPDLRDPVTGRTLRALRDVSAERSTCLRPGP